MYIYIWIHIHIYMHIYIYIHIHTCIYLFTYIYIHVYSYIYIHMHIRIYVFTYIYMYIHMHIFIDLHTFIYIYIYIYICIYIYISLYIYTYLRTTSHRGRWVLRQPVSRERSAIRFSNCVLWRSVFRYEKLVSGAWPSKIWVACFCLLKSMRRWLVSGQVLSNKNYSLVQKNLWRYLHAFGIFWTS